MSILRSERAMKAMVTNIKVRSEMVRNGFFHVSSNWLYVDCSILFHNHFPQKA
jgi:hypothetical protein